MKTIIVHMDDIDFQRMKDLKAQIAKEKNTAITEVSWLTVLKVLRESYLLATHQPKLLPR